MRAVFAKDGKVEIGVMAFMYMLCGSVRRWTDLPLADYDLSPAGWILTLHNFLFLHRATLFPMRPGDGLLDKAFVRQFYRLSPFSAISFHLSMFKSHVKKGGDDSSCIRSTRKV
jgi:hypothetical protein